MKPDFAPKTVLSQQPVDRGDLIREDRVGDYIICSWQYTTGGSRMIKLTVIPPSLPPVEIAEHVYLSYSIKDVTGDGVEDLLVQSGGNTTTTAVYELKETPKQILSSTTFQGDFIAWNEMFQDINQDGIDEFVTHDPAFFYYNMYCAGAISPYTKVIYQYTPDRGYFPASPNFPEQYRDDIEKDQTRIEAWAASPSSASGPQLYREANQCELLPLILDYLYSGQPEKAWNAMDRYYLYDDKAQFKADIEQKINKSPHFAGR